MRDDVSSESAECRAESARRHQRRPGSGPGEPPPGSPVRAVGRCVSRRGWRRLRVESIDTGCERSAAATCVRGDSHAEICSSSPIAAGCFPRRGDWQFRAFKFDMLRRRSQRLARSYSLRSLCPRLSEAAIPDRGIALRRRGRNGDRSDQPTNFIKNAIHLVF